MSICQRFLCLCFIQAARLAVADETNTAKLLLTAVEDPTRTEFIIRRDGAVQFAGLNLTKPGAKLIAKTFIISSPNEGQDGLLDFGNQANVLFIEVGSTLVFQRVSMSGILPDTAILSTATVPVRNVGLLVWPPITMAANATIGFDHATVVFSARWCGLEQLQKLVVMMRSRYGSEDMYIVDGAAIFIGANVSMSFPVVDRATNETVGYMRMWTSRTRLVCFPDPNYLTGGASPAPVPQLNESQSVSAIEYRGPQPASSSSGLSVVAIIVLAVCMPIVLTGTAAAVLACLLRRRRSNWQRRNSFAAPHMMAATTAATDGTDPAKEVLSEDDKHSHSGCGPSTEGAALQGQRDMAMFRARSWQSRYEAPTDLLLGKEIGQGSFGKVYKAYWQGIPVAVKVVTSTTKANSAAREVRRIQEGDLQIATAVSHPNVVPTYRIWLDDPSRGPMQQRLVTGMPLSIGPSRIAGQTDTLSPGLQAVQCRAQLQERLHASSAEQCDGGDQHLKLPDKPSSDGAHHFHKPSLHIAHIARTASSSGGQSVSLSSYSTRDLSDASSEAVHGVVRTESSEPDNLSTVSSPASAAAESSCAAGIFSKAPRGMLPSVQEMASAAPVSAFAAADNNATTFACGNVTMLDAMTTAGQLNGNVSAVQGRNVEVAPCSSINKATDIQTANSSKQAYTGQLPPASCSPDGSAPVSYPAPALTMQATAQAGSHTNDNEPAYHAEKLEEYHLLCSAQQRSMACGGAPSSSQQTQQQPDSVACCACGGSRLLDDTAAPFGGCVSHSAGNVCSHCTCHQHNVQQGEEWDVEGIPRREGQAVMQLDTCILMEYCEFGSLKDAVKAGKVDDPIMHQPSMEKVLLCLRDVAAGIAALHEHNVIHGDIKSANVLLKASTQQGDIRGYVCKIADLGLSRWFGPDGQTTHIITQTMGTVAYQPPEMLHGGKLSKAVDVYSLGVLAWELACGRLPFSSYHPGQVFYHVVVLKQREQIPEHIDPDLATLIRDCWHPDPSARPSAVETLSRIVDMLQRWQDG